MAATDKLRKAQRGVTLVETLVALAIMGLVTTSILVLIGQNTRFTANAFDRTYASIAADNLMVETLARRGGVTLGEETGQIMVGSQDWDFSKTISETPVEGILRVDIAVRAENSEQVIASATTIWKREE